MFDLHWFNSIAPNLVIHFMNLNPLFYCLKILFRPCIGTGLGGIDPSCPVQAGVHIFRHLGSSFESCNHGYISLKLYLIKSFIMLVLHFLILIHLLILIWDLYQELLVQNYRYDLFHHLLFSHSIEEPQYQKLKSHKLSIIVVQSFQL